jgi:SEC-C motif domain protein
MSGVLPKSQLAAPCPCGSGLVLSACCARYWPDCSAPTPEALMRSRYSAYVLGQVDYLVATWHPAARTDALRQSLADSAGDTAWLGLHICKSDAQSVEFVAFFAQPGGWGQLHEHSQFHWQDGHWYYCDGRFLPPITWPRNTPCFCGSGKKFKHCHHR